MSTRTKPTTSVGTPREKGPHGVTLLMRHIPGPRSTPVEQRPEQERLRRPRAEKSGEQLLVDLIPRSRRRHGRSPRKALRILRDMNAAQLDADHEAFRNERRQARADAKVEVA